MKTERTRTLFKTLGLFAISIGCFAVIGARAQHEVGANALAASMDVVANNESVFTTVASGNGFSIAIDKDFNLHAWGNNSEAQLGNGDMEFQDVDIPVNLTELSGNTLYGIHFKNLSLGKDFSLAIDTADSLYSWGSNSSGKLGIGEEIAQKIVATNLCELGTADLLAGKDISEAGAGDNHAIACDSLGGLYVWGDNTYGQLGNGTNVNSNSPLKLNALEGNPIKDINIDAVAAGENHSAAIGHNRKLYVWGRNDHGQLGNGNTTDSTTPICLSDLASHPFSGKSFSSVKLGASHSLALDSDGKLYAWGNNASGQLGNGNTTDSATPICLSGAEGDPFYGKVVTSISLGGSSSSVIADSKLYTWGDNSKGQLCQGSTDSSSTPVSVSDIKSNPLYGRSISSFAMGSQHAALISSGMLYTCGSNENSALGTNLDSQNEPILLGSPSVMDFVNKMFKYPSCTEYAGAYKALSATYNSFSVYETQQLPNIAKKDIPQTSYDSEKNSYISTIPTEITTASAKWSIIVLKKGPISYASLPNFLSSEETCLTLVCLGALLVTSLVLFVWRKAMRHPMA